MKIKNEVYYALFVIEIPYGPSEDEIDGEVVQWGAWRFRSTYVANGRQYLGQHGTSLLLARHIEGRALLTVYPRPQLALCDWDSRTTNRGISLPAPKEKVPGSHVHVLRVAWDDAHGIAVLLLETGMLWVLHYA